MPLTCEVAAQEEYYAAAETLFPPEIVRFLRKVQGDWRSGCWNWTSAMSRDNYAAFWGDSKTVPGHRWIYSKFRSAIPPGLELDHLCVRPWCVAPAHLEPVTKEENRRRISFRRDEAKAGRPILVKTGAASILELTAAGYFGLPIGGGVVLPGRPHAVATRWDNLLPVGLDLKPYSRDMTHTLAHQQFLNQYQKKTLEPVRS